MAFENLKNSLNAEDLVLGLALFLVAGVFSFSAVQDRYTIWLTEKEDIGFEVNSSSEIAEVGFFNHSVDLLMEDSANSTFYLDIDRDGSADEGLDGLVRDGKIHRASKLVDFRDGVYRLYFRYQDDGSEEDDAWMQVYRAERLG